MEEISYFDARKIFKNKEVIDSFLNNQEINPVTVEIDLTNLCNNKCVWCNYAEFRSKYYSTLSRNTVFKLIDDLKKLKTKAIVLSGGGEPLLHPDIVDIINYIGKNEIECGIVSNGRMLYNNNELMYAIAKYCKWIRISLDAGKRETYNLLHNCKKSREFDFILTSLKQLKSICNKLDSELTIGISFLVHPKNVLEIPLIYDICKNMHIDYLQIKPIFNYYIERYDEIFKLLVLMYKYIQRTEETQIFLPSKRFIDVINNNNKNYKKCLYAHFVSAIGADANVYPCCQLVGNPNFVLGNINDSSFEAIWKSQKRKEIINSIDVSKCIVCRGDEVNKLLYDYIDRKIDASEFESLKFKHENFI